MSLSDVVNVTVTAETTPITQAGFGLPMILDYHERFQERFRAYASIGSMLEDFESGDAAVRAARAIWSQNPSPPWVFVGRRANAPTHVEEIEIADVVDGATYTVEVNGQAVEHTAGESADAESIRDALVTAVNGLAFDRDHVTAAGEGAPTDKMTLTADVPGRIFTLRLSDTENDRLMTRQNVTADAGIADDLADVEEVNDDWWYAVVSTSQSKAELLALAAAIEARKKILLLTSGDSDILDGTATDDLFSSVQTLGHARTLPTFSTRPHLYVTSGWGGRVLPVVPGGANWAHQILRGVPVDRLTATEKSVIEDKSGNYFTRYAGANAIRWGTTPSGEFIDITRISDWTAARIQEGVVGILLRENKLPYTDEGLSRIENVIRGVREQGKANGAFRDPVGEEEEVIHIPALEDVGTNDLANRVVRNVTATFFLAVPVNKVESIGVTLSL